ncbi:MAG: hypothetical protein ACYSWP_03595, partial [Planctomycetota bacterium]
VGYNIYPGSISIDTNGIIVDPGNCAGVLDGNSMSSEQGSLYVGAANSPAEGDLFIVTLGGCTLEPGGDVSVTVSENALRSGVVMEDPEETPTVNLTGCTVNICEYPPVCQCWGDVVGNTSPAPDGIVNTADLGAFMGLLGPVGPPFDLGTVPPGYECWDIAGSVSPVPDGVLNMADLCAMMAWLGPRWPCVWCEPGCMPAPPSGP